MFLHVLLRQNGFGHPSEKLVVAQPLHDSICQCSKLSFCYESMGQLRGAVSIEQKQANQRTQKSEGKLRLEYFG